MEDDQYKIIDVCDQNNIKNMLIFNQQKFEKLIPASSNKLLFIGAVGRMRTGKSSALNNYYEIMTGMKTRVFSEIACCETNTKGIHIYHVPYDIMTSSFKHYLTSKFQESVDVVLLDCEGTESSNNEGTSKLYLINMLINSAIHIHISKAIDQSSYAKLCEAFVSSQELIKSMQSDMKNILPVLTILVKDTSQKAWLEAQNKDSALIKFEDLLRKYPNLYEYYKQFPNSSVEIIAPPNCSDGEYIVDCKQSQYWIQLEKVFEQSIQSSGLKTRNQLLNFLNIVIKNVNEKNLMNVKNELDSFYRSMFESEKNKLMFSIMRESIENLKNSSTYTKEEMRLLMANQLLVNLNKFESNISNISCKWIFDNLKEELQSDIEKILLRLEKVFENKRLEYLNKRETSKEWEEIKQKESIEITLDKVNTSHGTFSFKYRCCNNSNQMAEGCKETAQCYTDHSAVLGNALRKVNPISYIPILKDIKLFKKEEEKKIKNIKFHPLSWENSCNNCGQIEGSKHCMSMTYQVKENRYIGEFLKDKIPKYTMDDWKDSLFQGDAVETLNKIIDEFDIKE